MTLIFPGGDYSGLGGPLILPALFDPTSIADLALWLKADAGITLDTTSGINTVSNWANQASNGSSYDAARATKANQPEYVTNVVNGFPVVRWDGGTDDYLALSGTGLSLTNNIPGLTVFMAWKPTSSASITRLFYTTTNGSTTSGRAFVGKSNGNKVQAGGRRQEADSLIQGDGAGTIGGSWIITTTIFDYANSDLYNYLNGTLDGSTTSFQTNGNTPASNSNRIRIGNNGDGSQPYVGDLAEILVVKRPVTTASERQPPERYLGAKYGVAVA